MMSADLLPWHSAHFSHLIALRDQGRLGHAYLLEGPRGLGKRAFALYLARALLCQRPQAGHPCGTCQSCLLLAAGTYPDLWQVEPEEDKRAIRIEQLRDTVDFMSRTAGPGSRKVIIISPAEAMNVNAANALLKALEEPSPG